MLPIDTPNGDVTIQAGDGWQVRGMKGHYNGSPCIVTSWQPNAEDLAALQAGEPLYLLTLGTWMPNVALFTIGPDGQANV